MRTILIEADVKDAEKFREILVPQFPGFNIVTALEEVDTEEIAVVIIWLKVPNYLTELKNLDLILVCGSGIDHIINSPDLPRNIPLIRLVDPVLQDHVANYVVEYIFKQFFPYIIDRTPTLRIKEFSIAGIKKPKIGIMGLGLIGGFTADRLIDLGFEVCGWVRSNQPRRLNEVYVGTEKLGEFAEQCEILVCQLPLTNETKGILNKTLFDYLPNGAYLINIGRGAHLIEDDLIDALKANKLSGACLDVFEVEPLPLTHSFHSNNKITVTPHIAGYIAPETQASHAAKVIHSYYQQEKIAGLVDYQVQH